MSDSEDLHESQKPFRVFVSLLDEWNIGFPVIQAVFLDALKSLKRHADSGNHGAEVRPCSKSLFVRRSQWSIAGVLQVD